jgi:hypothetical protein
MVSSAAQSVSEYLASLPADRRAQVATMRGLLQKNLPRGFVETMQYGMISWVIPLARFPKTYNKQPLAIASLASQKNHLALYLMGAYASPGARAKLITGFARAGKKLDMGKSCLRWKTLDELPLDVVADAVAAVGVDDFIAIYEASMRMRAKPARSTAPKKAAPKKAAPKKAAPKRVTPKGAAHKNADDKKAIGEKAGAKKAPARKKASKIASA